MGFKIKKIVKSAIKTVTGVAGATLGGGLLGGGKEKQAAQVTETAPAQAPAAQVVETPKEDPSEGDASTESAKKAARSRGKRGLSVARSSGSGLNI